MRVETTRRGAIIHAVATSFGITAFSIYVAWNTYWLSQWRVPKSMLTALTGLPAPTTGGTRSFLCLCRLQWVESLYYNPMTIPILVIGCVSVVQLLRLRKVTASVGRAWFTILIAAWFLKLLSPPETW